MAEKNIEADLRTLTRKLNRLANDWKYIPAVDYERQHNELTAKIDQLLDEAQARKPGQPSTTPAE